jgi:hypothetical protein
MRSPPVAWVGTLWRHIVEANEVDVLAPPVFRDLEEVDHSLETRRARDSGSDVGIRDR